METNKSPQMEQEVPTEPMSLFDFLSREGSSIAMLPRINVSDPSPAAGRAPIIPPPPSPPAKRFLSVSLPSSPRPVASTISNRKKSGRKQSSPPTSDAASQNSKQEKHHLYIGRSKSCGEGRNSTPTIEFEVCLKRVDTVDHHGSRQYEAKSIRNIATATNSNGTATQRNSMDKSRGEGYKCAGALCLFLPAFIKGKPLSKKEAVDIQSMISNQMSLEKFECGSWSAAAMVNENFGEDESSEETYDRDSDHVDADRHSVNLYYELPLEMIRKDDSLTLLEKHDDIKGILTTNRTAEERKSCYSNHDPSLTVFLERPEIKGILTNSHLRSTEGRKSNYDPARHVRFSTEAPTLIVPSSPSSCIAPPRLGLAREEFNAFLEAQNV